VSQLSEFPEKNLFEVLTRPVLGHGFFPDVHVLLPVNCIVDQAERLLVFCRVKHKESPLVHMFTCEIPKMAVAANSSDVMAFGARSKVQQH